MFSIEDKFTRDSLQDGEVDKDKGNIMEYIREVEIIINGEEFDDIEESIERLELLENDSENNIKICIDTNKTTYETETASANYAIEYIETTILWIGE